MALTISTKGTATMKISDAKAKTSGSAAAPVTGSVSSVSAGVSVFGSGSPTVVPTFSSIAFGPQKVGGESLTSLSPAEYEIYNAAGVDQQDHPDRIVQEQVRPLMIGLPPATA